MEKQQTATHITLLLDRQEARLLQILIAQALGEPAFIAGAERHGYKDAAISFFNQTIEKIHNLGWCDCEEHTQS